MKFHTSPDGKVSKCSAKSPATCPYGATDGSHVSAGSLESAVEYFVTEENTATTCRENGLFPGREQEFAELAAGFLLHEREHPSADSETLVRGQEFENRALAKLREEFRNVPGVKFIPAGGATSGVSDILVMKNDVPLFFVECKMGKAQAGQFVTETDADGREVYAQSNTHQMTPAIQEVLPHLPKKGDVPVDSSVAARVVAEHYSQKFAPYIMTETKSGDVILTRTEDVGEVFDVKLTKRMKPSGSRSLPAGMVAEVGEKLQKQFPGCAVKSGESLGKPGKTFIEMPKNVADNGVYIDGLVNGKRVFLSPRGNGLHEVRVTSPAVNPSVISVVSVKDNPKVVSMSEFRDELVKVDIQK